jgi:hypothetical protein
MILLLSFLRILETVSKLMKVPKKANDDRCSTYLVCMEEAIKYETINRGEGLMPFAEVCYMKLKFMTERNS